MTTPLRLLLALAILMLTFIVAWVVFFDGPWALVSSALGLCGVLLLAALSSRRGEQAPNRDGTRRH